MDLRLFFDNFEIIAAAPNGVKKLRELILQLAVRAKLVAQDPADEPAGKLLERIRKEKTRLLEEKLIKKIPALLQIDEGYYDLPKSWKWSSLAEVGLINPRNDINDDLRVSFIPMTLVPQVYGEPIKSEVRSWGELKKGFTHFAEGDVCLAKITPCFQNRKSAVLENLKNRYGAGTTELHIFRPISNLVVPTYVLIYLKSSDFIDNAIPRMSGTAGQQRVPNDYFACNPFPLPPIAEQKRIVAKVDELMKLCDTLETQQQQNRSHLTQMQKSAIAQLLSAPDADAFAQYWQDIVGNFELLFDDGGAIGDLRSAVLQLAVQGKLVRQDSGDEPAEKLLSRIAENSSQGKLRSRAIAPIIEIATLPELPEQWTWAKFPELGEFGRGKSKHRPRNDPSLYKDGRYPLVQTGDVARSSGSISTYTNVYNDVGLAQSKLWRKGTLCITIAANIADTGILEFDSCFPDSVVGFVPSPEIGDSQYFMYFMRTAQEHLLSYAPATAQKNINLGILEEVMIPLPPVQEIYRIVTKVNQLMALCDTLQTHLTQRQASAIDLAEVAVRQVLDRE
jgi:type I restriction enzyme, S subunit